MLENTRFLWSGSERILASALPLLSSRVLSSSLSSTSTPLLSSRAYASGSSRDRRRILEVARQSQIRARQDQEHRRRLLASLPPLPLSTADPSAPAPTSTAVAMAPAPPLSSEPSSLRSVTDHKTLMITRDVEWGNVILGFEQANKYVARDEFGTPVAYIAEEAGGMGSMITRQMLRTHRPMTATVLGTDGRVLFRVRRAFFWINSTLIVEDAEGRQLGEVHQRWHLLKRNYDVFIDKRQFAAISAPTLAWQFDLRDESNRLLATIDRNFSGFAKELFTDAGCYAIHFGATVDGREPAPPPAPPVPLPAGSPADGSVVPRGELLPPAPIDVPLTSLTERAIALATAISIDFDYFSQHSSSGGMMGGGMGFIPIPWGIGGGGGAEPTEAGAAEGSGVSEPPPFPSSGGLGSGMGRDVPGGASPGVDPEEMDDSGSFMGGRGLDEALEGSGGEEAADLGGEDAVSWGDVMGSLGKLFGNDDD